jgi:hypothetical protein
MANAAPMVLEAVSSIACNRCGLVKPHTDDFFRRYCKSGSLPWQQKRKVICRECETAYALAWNKANPEKAKEHHKKQYQKTKHLRDPSKRRAQKLLKNFGISHAEYAEMLLSQGGRCAACGTNELGFHKHFNVDHCHTTGKIRGLLCGNCNRAIGLLRDSVETALAVALYLERHK